MGRTKQGTVTRLPLPSSEAGSDGSSPSSLRQRKDPRAAALILARVLRCDDGERTAELDLGGIVVPARLDPVLDAVVVRTAIERGERLLVEEDADGWVVLGALRTSATPGVDAGDEYRIEAKRLRLEGTHDLKLVSGASSLVMRAAGHLELFAQNITSRASSIHKIVGRMLHLN